MKITVKRKTDANAGSLWTYLADFSNVHRFHPMLNGSHFTNGSQTCEVGSVRQCDFKDGSFLKEKILEWEEGSHYKIEVVESSMPIKKATATLGVVSLGLNRSEVFMKVDMIPSNKLMQPLMYFNFKYKVIPGILKGLEDLYLSEKEHETLLKTAS